MNLINAAVACFLLLLTASCSAPKTPGCSTGNVLVEARADSISVRAGAIERVIKDNSISMWRESVAEQTRFAVEEGNRDLEDVRRLVCERTKDAEAKARKLRLAIVEAIDTVFVQTREEIVDVEEELIAEMNEAARDSLYKMADAEFTKRRDELIERYFKEAMEQAASVPPSDKGDDACVSVMSGVPTNTSSGLAIGHLKTKGKLVTIRTGPDGALHTVHDADGAILAEDLSAAQLLFRYPELSRVVEQGIADWAGMDLPSSIMEVDVDIAPATTYRTTIIHRSE